MIEMGVYLQPKTWIRGPVWKQFPQTSLMAKHIAYHVAVQNTNSSETLIVTDLMRLAELRQDRSDFAHQRFHAGILRDAAVVARTRSLDIRLEWCKAHHNLKTLDPGIDVFKVWENRFADLGACQGVMMHPRWSVNEICNADDICKLSCQFVQFVGACFAEWVSSAPSIPKNTRSKGKKKQVSCELRVVSGPAISSFPCSTNAFGDVLLVTLG